MEIDTGLCVLRPWRDDDIDHLASHLNDEAVWRNLSDIVPHPYTKRDAQEWISRCKAEGVPAKNMAVVVDGRACGGIGMHLLAREKAHVANVGYWLGKQLWGRGIATVALGAFCDHAFALFPVRRLYATVFAWNPASARVLEKNGFIAEGRLRDAVLKDGEYTDELVYGRLEVDLGEGGRRIAEAR